jgi:hypothetical protein
VITLAGFKLEVEQLDVVASKHIRFKYPNKQKNRMTELNDTFEGELFFPHL